MYGVEKDTVILINDLCNLVEKYSNEYNYIESSDTIKSLKSNNSVETALNIYELTKTKEGTSLLIRMLKNTIKDTPILNDINKDYSPYLNNFTAEEARQIVKKDINKLSLTDNNMIRHWDFYVDLIRIVIKLNKIKK